MRLARGHRKVLGAIILVALLFAVLAVMCPQSIHTAMSGTASAACIAMAHSTGFASLAGSESSASLLSQLAAAMVAFTALFMVARPNLAVRQVVSRPGASCGSLNERLRL